MPWELAPFFRALRGACAVSGWLLAAMLVEQSRAGRGYRAVPGRGSSVAILSPTSGEGSGGGEETKSLLHLLGLGDWIALTI